jgi:hypothetical protein
MGGQMQTEYTYIFIREDLTPAQQIIQAGHATYDAGSKWPRDHSPHFVLFSAKNEEELMKIRFELQSKGIEHTTFYEPDHDTGHTAIATKPISGDDRQHFKRYRMKR